MRRRPNIYRQKAFRLRKWLETKSGDFEKDQETKKEAEKNIKLLLK